MKYLQYTQIHTGSVAAAEGNVIKNDKNRNRRKE